ncbi:hypothetical protein [Bradyrhizobium sp. STM 3843]|uniref:hypothetical protein n=1 Tax=Bradyrhizobium sp. STM 3843 TaxID=551947 RepID=UPI0011122F90|nr:hypothetical protein [Bradyrhizobium sp. STM 3843]
MTFPLARFLLGSLTRGNFSACRFAGFVDFLPGDDRSSMCEIPLRPYTPAWRRVARDDHRDSPGTNAFNAMGVSPASVRMQVQPRRLSDARL